MILQAYAAYFAWLNFSVAVLTISLKDFENLKR